MSIPEPISTAVELSIIVPVYNEEETVPAFLERMRMTLAPVTDDYEIIFVMDPGTDNTEQVIRDAVDADPRNRLIVTSRRFGQPACTLAGLDYCRGRACVTIDVDLQDPPELIRDMVAKWKEGFDVVYATRRSRKGETWIHLLWAYTGYWLMNRISDVEIPRNTGDYRLMDRKVIDRIRALPETHGYMRGLVPYAGYRQTRILYDRETRKTGTSKYNQIIGSMYINMNALVAFSHVPLRLALVLGLLLCAAGGLGLLFLLLSPLFLSGPGITQTALFVLVLLVGGLILFCMGIMGEYIGRIYDEARRRPKYIVDKVVNFGE